MSTVTIRYCDFCDRVATESMFLKKRSQWYDVCDEHLETKSVLDQAAKRHNK